MNRSSQKPISDELLSAYIDGVVTNEEKATVEAAMAADPGLAWELESLRQTVQLVQELPPVLLPRSFALVEAQVADVLAERRNRASASVRSAVPRSPVAPAQRNWWQELLAFFSSGNLVLRNAMAVAALFFVVVLVTSPGVSMSPNAPQNDTPQSSTSQSALPAQEASPTLAQAEPVATEPAQTAAEESAPVALMAEPAAAEMAAPAESGAMKAGPAEMESGASPAVLRAEPARIVEPVGAAPNGIGGGETGPAAYRAVPANADPAGEFPPPVGGADAPPGNVAAAQPAAMALEMPASENGDATAATGESAEEPVAEEPTVEEAVVEAAVVEAAAADAAEPLAEPLVEEVAEEFAVSETPQEPATQAAPAPVEPGAWSLWRLLQIGLAGLVVVLGVLWLTSKRA